LKNFALIWIFCWLLSPHWAHAQRDLEGLVYDVVTKQRLGEVYVKNLRTQEAIYNNSRGEFKIQVLPGDRLQFRKLGYNADTVEINNQVALIINLKETIKQIQTVHIYGRRNPDDVRDELKRDYKKAYDIAAPKELLSVGMGGAGLSIDALYNMVSKEAKNARRFTQFLDKLHRENIVDYYFTPELVRNLLGLEGEQLKVFMRLFRPTYDFIASNDHYQLVKYIKSKYEIFKLHPNLRPLRELPDIKLDVNKEK